MNKISFYTALNANFYPLSSILIQSLLSAMDEKINKIFLYDIGLIKRQREFLLSLSEKINIIDSNQTVRPKFIYDDSWKQVIAQKTEGLLKVCKKDHYPIVMMDSDMMVIEDLSDEIYENCDFQVCKKEEVTENKFGLKLTHAGSWFVINNPNGKEFINLWRKNVLNTSSIHTESPALTEVLNNSSSDFNYKENEISTVAASKYRDGAKVLHFKSRGLGPINIPYERINIYAKMPSSESLKLAEYIKNTP